MTVHRQEEPTPRKRDRYQPVPLTGRAQRLTIFVDETDRVAHKPLFTEIVHRAQQSGMAGASVFHGFEGYGASNHLHTTRFLSLSEDLPVMIVLVDTAERIAGFLAEIDELLTDGLVVVEDVHVVHYAGRRPPSQEAAPA
jgi:PII-like signaling protein